MRGGYVLSVSQLNEYVTTLLSNDALLSSVSIKGEISGFKRHSSGHLYFSMKDEGALVRCVMFRQNAMGLSCDLEDGMQVVATGYASLYSRDGQFQFYVKSIEGDGEGELYRRFMRLKAKLGAEGLFDEAHKKRIPFLPRCVGIVTSPTGAAVQDITKIIRRRFPTMDIVFCPAKVQGEGAADEIARAIRRVEADSRADVIIVGRGGGSLEDLWAFNEEKTARAIYECKVPVVSAVGHETDFTIADFTADLRAATPSAAAELCVPEYEAVSLDIDSYAQSLKQVVRQRLDVQRQRINAAMGSGALAKPKYALQSARAELVGIEESVKRLAKARIEAERQLLCKTETALEALSPAHTLARGYAIIKKDEETLATAESIHPGDRITVVMKGAEIGATANEVKLAKETE